jgi:hypothetical protein
MARLVNSTDKEVMIDACWGLAFISDDSGEIGNIRITHVLQQGVAHRLVQLLKYVLILFYFIFYFIVYFIYIFYFLFYILLFSLLTFAFTFVFICIHIHICIHIRIVIIFVFENKLLFSLLVW